MKERDVDALDGQTRARHQYFCADTKCTRATLLALLKCMGAGSFGSLLFPRSDSGKCLLLGKGKFYTNYITASHWIDPDAIGDVFFFGNFSAADQKPAACWGGFHFIGSL